MFGVVLWSDQIRKRAVIWCEDHGDLAFFSGDDEKTMDGTVMEPGDLVQFDVRSERHMRLASNPKLVATDEYPTLANDLMKAGSDLEINVKPQERQSNGKIVVFDPKPMRPQLQARSRRRVS